MLYAVALVYGKFDEDSILSKIWRKAANLSLVRAITGEFVTPGWWWILDFKYTYTFREYIDALLDDTGLTGDADAQIPLEMEDEIFDRLNEFHIGWAIAEMDNQINRVEGVRKARQDIETRILGVDSTGEESGEGRAVELK